ncbi:MAG TPA: hypothetical protein VGD22_01720 [Sphingobacteriaceae bacterium]
MKKRTAATTSKHVFIKYNVPAFVMLLIRMSMATRSPFSGIITIGSTIITTVLKVLTHDDVI